LSLICRRGEVGGLRTAGLTDVAARAKGIERGAAGDERRYAANGLNLSDELLPCFPSRCSGVSRSSRTAGSGRGRELLTLALVEPTGREA